MMTRTLMAAAVALAASAPLAFAATYAANDSDWTTEHCTYLDQQFAKTQYPSEAARQVAEEHADSTCRQDHHTKTHASTGAASDRGGRASRTSFILLR